MSERKVLNKYYPPDFDPAKVPKLRQDRERQYTVRTMAPFNMRCETCGDYIYQGKKFNAKTENVQDERYLGLRIYRFYIKCPKCISEISFKTDPENEDYKLEHGATRLFEAAKMFRKATEQEKLDREEEEANNPMKVLENRTKDSKLEMEILENLEELKEINARKLDINYSEILHRKAESAEETLRKQEQEDEEEIRRIFGKPDATSIKRLQDDSDEEWSMTASSAKTMPSAVKRTNDSLSNEDPQPKKQKPYDPKGSKVSIKSALAGLVKPKNIVKLATPTESIIKTGTPEALSLKQVDTSSVNVDTSSVNVDTSSVNVDAPSVHVDTPSVNVDTSSVNDRPIAPKLTNEAGLSEKSETLDEFTPEPVSASIREGLVKKISTVVADRGRQSGNMAGGLSLLGGYAYSDDSDESN